MITCIVRHEIWVVHTWPIFMQSGWGMLGWMSGSSFRCCLMDLSRNAIHLCT